MGATGGNFIARINRPKPLRVLLGAAALATLALVAIWTGQARAAACDTSWTGLGGDGSWYTAGNWSAGVPSSSMNACITLPGSYTVLINPVGHPQAEAESLTLGAATGTQTVEIQGFNDGTAHDAALLLDNSSSITSNGAVLLTAGCSGGGCTSGAAASLNLATGSLSNAGSITAAQGSDGGANDRTLHGNLVNTGSIDVNSPTQYTGGTLDNQGTITLAGGQELTVLGVPASLTNDTGGSISNGGGTGDVDLTFGSTFNQGAGTTNPKTANPLHPAVIVDGSNLNYTGGGASTIAAEEEVPVTGDLAAAQNLVVQGTATPAEATWSTTWSSAGSITVTGSNSSGVKTTGGTFINTGTLTAVPSGSATRFVRGSLTNSGTFDINAPTAFPTPGSTLTQTGGTTLLSGQTLDMSGSVGTFQLQGGLLQGTGTSILNGSLNNSGGNVFVGSNTASGHMTVGSNYMQQSGGRLTVVINGTTIGSGYSQLSMGGSSSLNGTLAVNTLSGPQSGKLYTILGSSSGSVSGKFSKVLGQFVPNATSPTAGYKLDYFNTAVGLDAEAIFKLTVKRAGPGTGTVTSSPAGINCGGKCQAFYFKGQTVKLTEHPGSGWVFKGWSGGGCSGTSSTCQVSMSQARAVTATFAHRTTTRLTSSKNPVKKGKKVTFTATVSPHPDGGTVKFTIGGKAISGCGAKAVSPATGKATCTVRTRATGSHRVQAIYSGDANFAGSKSNVLTQKVKR